MMRAYKTISGIVNRDGIENKYREKENKLLKSLGFEYWLGFYKKLVGDYIIWINSKEGGYIDYQDRFSGQRIAPQTIEIKKNKELGEIIKSLKHIIK